VKKESSKEPQTKKEKQITKQKGRLTIRKEKIIKNPINHSLIIKKDS